MSAHSDIRLDFNNMMADQIGPVGLRRDEIDSLMPQVKPIHEGLSDLRRLGQLPAQDLPYHEEECRRILHKAKEVRDRADSLLLLGVGGSALGASFLSAALAPSGGLKVRILSGLDSAEWRVIEKETDWKRTFLLVVSKSGKTLETLAAFLFFRDRLEARIGSGWGRQVMVITDPHDGGPLRKFAKENGIGGFDIPPGVGGRFSVLTAAGLFPAACTGVDIQELLSGARGMDERCKKPDPWFNPALMSAVVHHLFDQRRKRKVRVVMPYGSRLKSYAPWFSQLWAESLGKRMSLGGKEIFAGSTPVPAVGPEDQHSQLQLYLEGPADKTVTFVAAEREEGLILPSGPPRFDGDVALAGRDVGELLRAARLATEESLREANRPNQTILLKEVTPHSIGQLLYMAELETVYAGELYNVNPFDQPGVETIKRNIRDYLSGKNSERKNRTYLI